MAHLPSPRRPNPRLPLRSALRAAALCGLAIATAADAWAFDLQGHRGARGLAPENTLAAFDQAMDLGVHTLELDIAITADGVPVISHDPALNPLFTRDAQGRWLEGESGPLIHRLSLAELQRHDVGRLRPGTPYAGTFASQTPRDGGRHGAARHHPEL